MDVFFFPASLRNINLWNDLPNNVLLHGFYRITANKQLIYTHINYLLIQTFYTIYIWSIFMHIILELYFSNYPYYNRIPNYKSHWFTLEFQTYYHAPLMFNFWLCPLIYSSSFFVFCYLEKSRYQLFQFFEDLLGELEQLIWGRLCFSFRDQNVKWILLALRLRRHLFIYSNPCPSQCT